MVVLIFCLSPYPCFGLEWRAFVDHTAPPMVKRFHGLQMVQFECPRVIHPLVSFTFGVHCGVPFLYMQEKGNAACGLLIKWNSFCKNRFCGLQMVQLECPRVIYPLVLFTFGVYCGVPFSLHAGKGKCCMWPVKKVEIPASKKGFVDCKWSNSNAPGS